MRLLLRKPQVIRGNAELEAESDILRALRIPRAQHLAELSERGLKQAIARAKEQALSRSAFESSFRLLRVAHITNDHVVGQDGITFLGSQGLATRAQGAIEAAIIVTTLGMPWEALLGELRDKDEPAEAWFVDAIGTRMVSRAANLVEKRVTREVQREGLVRLNRYRPGYGDWSPLANAPLCEFAEAKALGIIVNEAGALYPRKSLVTAVFYGEMRDD